MNPDKLYQLADETVSDIFDVLEVIDARLNSRFQRPSKAQIQYLLATTATLGSTVLELTGSCLEYEKIISDLEEKIRNQSKKHDDQP